MTGFMTPFWQSNSPGVLTVKHLLRAAFAGCLALFRMTPAIPEYFSMDAEI
jgi:hypothetical protein